MRETGSPGRKYFHSCCLEYMNRKVDISAVCLGSAKRVMHCKAKNYGASTQAEFSRTLALTFFDPLEILVDSSVDIVCASFKLLVLSSLSMST